MQNCNQSDRCAVQITLGYALSSHNLFVGVFSYALLWSEALWLGCFQLKHWDVMWCDTSFSTWSGKLEKKRKRAKNYEKKGEKLS